METFLAAVVLQGRRRVAVLDYLESFCPITLGHVQCVVEAQKILTGDSPPLGDVKFEPFAASISLIWVNGDSFVRRSLLPRPCRDRHMLQCAVRWPRSSWVHCVNVNLGQWLQGLQRKFEDLQLSVWCLNGADDVVKYQKWPYACADSRYITMGRPGHTQLVLDGIRTSKTWRIRQVLPCRSGLPDSSSSTEARVALSQKDTHKLDTAAPLGHRVVPTTGAVARRLRCTPSTAAQTDPSRLRRHR